MNLYLITQSVNHGYDTFDSAIVAARSEDDARLIYPSWDTDSGRKWDGNKWLWHLADGRVLENSYSCWTTPNNVQVEFLGKARKGTERGCVLASFNAG